MEAEIEPEIPPQGNVDDPNGPIPPDPTPPPDGLPVTLPEGFVATRLVSTYNKEDLKSLARHFGLSDQGNVDTVKARVRGYLYENAAHFAPIPAFRPLFIVATRNRFPIQERTPSAPPRTPSPVPSTANGGRRRNQRRGFPDVPPQDEVPPRRAGSERDRQQGRRRSASPRREQDRGRSASRAPSPRQQMPAFRAERNGIFGDIPDGEYCYIHVKMLLFFFPFPSLHGALHYILHVYGAHYMRLGAFTLQRRITRRGALHTYTESFPSDAHAHYTRAKGERPFSNINT